MKSYESTYMYVPNIHKNVEKLVSAIIFLIFEQNYYNNEKFINKT
jgi:hypothetical protein